ncbi:MAG: hypothetical protein OEY01_10030 [Desulfobulbaceae bacterium]|nr:hypothetical protein [Desulfobulbaceae bacterium]HIJ79311.1 hypothetical protein [Deltaproteobacteria bacterium]
MVQETVKKGSWFERYIPFVARSPKMQVQWLETAFRKGMLSSQEITPYIKLLLAPENEQHPEAIKLLLKPLKTVVVEKMLLAADIYDTPKLFALIESPSLQQAVIALRKAPPPYEEAQFAVISKLFQAIHDCSDELLRQAAVEIKNSPAKPNHFDESYDRFQEIIEDEKFLSALYPKAKVKAKD